MWKIGPQPEVGKWYQVESPVQTALQSVVSTVDGPYAIDGAGALIRRDEPGDWDVVFDDGPATRNNKLNAAAATAGGERVWFAGSSGALGYYDVPNTAKHDYTAPMGKTSTWTGVAVSGRAGNEKILVANGSGEVLPGYVDGRCPQWGQVSKPAGSGASIAALAAGPDGYGYVVNTSGSVFKTTADEMWERIGIENAQVVFTDVYVDSKSVLVTAGDGRVYRYEPSCRNWTPLGVASVTLNDVARSGDELVAVGNGGTVYRKKGDEQWMKRPTPVSNDLLSVALSDGIDVTVGKSGIILERGEKEKEKKSGSQQRTSGGATA